MCRYDEDRGRVITEYTDEELLKVVTNHNTLPQFLKPEAWTFHEYTWAEICAWKTIVRQEARRRGLL